MIIGNKTKRLITLVPIFLLAIFFTSCSENPKAIYNRLDQQAEQLIAEGNYQQAISTWDQLLQKQPDSAEIYLKIGNAGFVVAKYHKALQAFEQFLAMKPTVLETWLLAAQIQLLIGDIHGAELSLGKAQEYRNSVRGLIIYGDMLAAQNKFTQAEEQYRKAVQKKETHPVALARLSLILLGQNKTQEAKEIFANLIAIKNKSAELLLQIGQYYLLAGDTSNAVDSFRKAIAKKPADINLQIRMAMFCANKGLYPKAIAILTPMVARFPSNRFIKKMLIDSLLLSGELDQVEKIFLTLEGTEKDDVDFRLLQGKYYMNTGKINAAASQFLAVVEKEADLPIGHYFLGLAYFAGGQVNLAQKSFIKCLTLDPDFSEAELALADILYKNKSYELALQHAQRVAEKEPENCRVHQIMGNIFLAQGRQEDALKKYQAALSLNPQLFAPLFYSSRALFRAGKQNEALLLLKNILDQKPQLVDALLDYIYFLAKAGRGSEAINFIEKSIAQQAESFGHYLHCILALLLKDTKETDQAISAFHEALKISPTMKTAYMHLFEINSSDQEKSESFLKEAITRRDFFVEAYIMLADLYGKTNQGQKAISLLEEALAENPGNPWLANNLAWLYVEFQPEDLDEAMRLAQKAYETLSDNAAIVDTLGWIYYKKNMLTRAKWLLEEAQKLDPDNQEIRRHLKAILQGM